MCDCTLRYFDYYHPTSSKNSGFHAPPGFGSRNCGGHHSSSGSARSSCLDIRAARASEGRPSIQDRFIASPSHRPDLEGSRPRSGICQDYTIVLICALAKPRAPDRIPEVQASRHAYSPQPMFANSHGQLITRAVSPGKSSRTGIVPRDALEHQRSRAGAHFRKLLPNRASTAAGRRKCFIRPPS